MENPFYTPPPNQPNAAAAFWSSFLRTRAPYTRSIFEARLAALDTSAQDQAIAQLAQQLAGLRKAEQQAREGYNQQLLDQGKNANEARANDLKAQEILASIYRSDNEFNASLARTRGGIQQARINLKGDLLEASVLESEAQRDVQKQLEGRVSDILTEMRNTGDTDAALSKLDQALVSTREQFGPLNSIEAGGIASRIGQAISAQGGADDQFKRDATQLVGGVFGQGVSMPDENYMVGAPTAQGRDELVGNLQGLMGERTGSVSAGGRTRTRGLHPGLQAWPGAGGGAPGGAPASGGVGDGGGLQQPDAERLRQAGDRIQELIDDMRERDPHARLGGFFDPLPGGGTRPARPRRAATARPERTLTADQAKGEVDKLEAGGKQERPLLRLLADRAQRAAQGMAMGTLAAGARPAIRQVTNPTPASQSMFNPSTQPRDLAAELSGGASRTLSDLEERERLRKAEERRRREEALRGR